MAERKIKLFIIVSEAWVFMSHRLSLAKAAMSYGYDVTVITRVGQYGDKLAKEGLNVIDIDFVRSSDSPLKDLVNVFSLVKIFRKHKPDIIHNVSVKIILLGTIAGLISKVNVIINAYTGLGYVFSANQFKARLIRFFLNPILKLLFISKKCWAIFQNPDDMNLFLKLKILSNEKCVLIKGSGVDTNEFPKVSDNNNLPVVMLASRMLWDKGVGEFVGVAKMAAEEALNAKFILVGDTDSQNPMAIERSKLEEWTRQGFVIWEGHSNTMPAVMKKSSIVCLPSYREGLPKVLLEAASSGRPLVAADVPGCREIVKHGVNGFLVPVKDTGALYEAIKKLVLNSSMRKEMGDNSREYVEKELSSEVINKKIIDFYGFSLSKLK